MRVLGIDTATWTAGVGIVDGAGVLANRSLAVSTSHAGPLLPLIEESLAEAGVRLVDLDLLAISIGPGSFTGLRIGLSVAKGLAIATAVPVVGVPTLEAVALAAGPRRELICPVLDARKGEVYTATFHRRGEDLQCVAAAAAVTPEELAAQLAPPCVLLGDGVDAYAPLWRERLGEGAELVPSAAVPPRGAIVARLGEARMRASGPEDLARLEPDYCRKSEAELHRNAVHLSPISRAWKN